MERMSSTLLLFTGCYLTKEWSYLFYPLVTRFLSRRRRGWHWGSFLLKEIPMSCLELVTPTSKIMGHLLTTFIQMPLVCKTLSWTTFLQVMPVFPSPLLLSLPFYLLAWLLEKDSAGDWTKKKKEWNSAALLPCFLPRSGIFFWNRS